MEVDERKEGETSGTRSGYGSDVDPRKRIPAIKLLNLGNGASNIANVELEWLLVWAEPSDDGRLVTVTEVASWRHWLRAVTIETCRSSVVETQ
jgi:hypothetical protein